MEGGKASAGQQGRRGKKALGCRIEGESKTQTQGARQNDREKRDREQDSTGRGGQWERGIEKEKNTEEE